MTRRAKIVVGVVMLAAVVLAGSAIAQATSSHAPKQQRVRAAHPASALHKKVRSVQTAKVNETHVLSNSAEPLKVDDDLEAGDEQPEAQESEAADDDRPEAKDDDSSAQNEQADDDDQGEQEQATVDDDDDDGSAQADHEDDDDASGAADDDEPEDDD